MVTGAAVDWVLGVETITLAEVGSLAQAGELARAVERVMMDARGVTAAVGSGATGLARSSLSSGMESPD